MVATVSVKTRKIVFSDSQKLGKKWWFDDLRHQKKAEKEKYENRIQEVLRLKEFERFEWVSAEMSFFNYFGSNKLC